MSDKPDFGTCPACDKPRLSGQFFVPEFDGLQTIHVKCAKKLGWTDPEGNGATHFDPETGELVPLNAADEAAADAEQDATPDDPPPAPPKGAKGPLCLVRAPNGATCVSAQRADGTPLSVVFKGGAPKWVDEESAVAVVNAGGLIEDRK